MGDKHTKPIDVTDGGDAGMSKIDSNFIFCLLITFQLLRVSLLQLINQCLGSKVGIFDFRYKG